MLESLPTKMIPAYFKRNAHAKKSVSAKRSVSVGEAVVGNGGICWMAGPAYVESVNQMLDSGSNLSELGAKFIRTRAYWPQAKSADFQRHLISGLKLLKATAKHFGLYVVSEIVSCHDIEIMAKYCDVIEVSPKHTLDYKLLKGLIKLSKPIILHRDPAIGIRQFLGIIAYLEREGCSQLILAEDGARGFDYLSPNLLDLSSIVSLRRETRWPILVDCSAIAKDASYIENLAVAAITAGADGVLAELEDGPQYDQCNPKALIPMQLQGIMQRACALKHTLNALAHQQYKVR